LSAPDDVAVFGFDGLEHQLVSRPVLSTMIQPIRCLGQEAVRILLGRIVEPESAPVQRFLETEMALRVSCGCPASVEQREETIVEGGVPA
jgi:LacI family transcriptional regulator